MRQRIEGEPGRHRHGQLRHDGAHRPGRLWRVPSPLRPPLCRGRLPAGDYRPGHLEQKAPGEAGELVVTTLTRQGMPVLRYRTKDITPPELRALRLRPHPCAHGKGDGPHRRYAHHQGVNVFPSQIESVLVGMENVGPHYQLVVRKKNYLDTLEVKVELIDGSLLESFGRTAVPAA